MRSKPSNVTNDFPEGGPETSSIDEIARRARAALGFRQPMRDVQAFDGGDTVGLGSRPLTPEVASRLGRYLVIDELGRGGMGVVLHAYDPKLQREVALKRLRASRGSAELQTRMLREAHAMAKLNHPNVVAVYDFEVLGEDVLLSMEYVDGCDLRRWLREARSPAEIVRLFVEAGRGLDAAHAAGLLHRDFKPANVLVTRQGVAKVTDFGLARMDEWGSTSDLSARTDSVGRLAPPTDGTSRSQPLTEAGCVMGTPIYMAPEQHRGDRLTAEADQYAFCVSLWEALTGKPPFAVRGASRLVERKRNGPPPWPESTPKVPKRVLQAIARGLSPTPDARWPSMSALLEVLEWDPRRERSRPWLVAGGVLAVALGGGGLQAWLVTRAERCSGSGEHLEGIWGPKAKAQVKRALLGVGASYAMGTWERAERTLDQYAARWQTSHRETCEATTVRGEQSVEVMDLRMACLHRARVDLRAAVQVLSQADAEVVRNTEKVTGGLPNLDLCSDIERLQAEVEPPPDEDATSVEAARAHIAAAEAFNRAGQHEAAADAVEAATSALGEVEYGPVQVELSTVHAQTLERRGEYEASEEAWRAALRLASEHGTRHDVCRSARKLVYVLGHHRKKLDAAAEHLALLDGACGADPHDEPRRNLARGVLLADQGRYEEAEAELRTALRLQIQTLGPLHSHVSGTRSHLAIVLAEQGRYEEAEAENRAVLELLTQTLGPHHPDLAIFRNNLALVLDAQGKLEQAEVEHRAALDLYTQTLGPGHPNVATSRANLALILRAEGKYGEAEAELRAALDLYLETLGSRHPHVATSRDNLANVLADQGKYEEAEVEHRAALDLYRQTLGSEHPYVSTAWANLALVIAEQGRHEEAEAEHRAALELQDRVLGAQHPDVAKSRRQWAASLLSRNRAREALHPAKRAWSVLEHHADPHERAEAAFVLAKSLWAVQPDTSAIAQARDLAKRARLELLDMPNPDPSLLANIEQWIARHS